MSSSQQQWQDMELHHGTPCTYYYRAPGAQYSTAHKGTYLETLQDGMCKILTAEGRILAVKRTEVRRCR